MEAVQGKGSDVQSGEVGGVFMAAPSRPSVGLVASEVRDVRAAS